MTRALDRRAALVTGASQGLGLAIARACVDAGGSVMICARDAAKLCGGEHSAETLQCLASAKRGVSIQCTKTVADAGYQ